MNKPVVNIGTRGSKLALFQAEQVKYKIESLFPGVTAKLKIINTKGDEILNVSLSKIGDKGLFTKELEIALKGGDIDMAVHSLKDMPTEFPEHFKIGAVLERADFRDALVSLHHKTLKELTPADRIATSSLRRKAGLLHLNKEYQIIDIRGNVHTRLRKMEEGYCDAIVMAAAGLKRLGLDSYISEILEPELFIPAVSQGIIAVETRRNDPFMDELCERLNHAPTGLTASAERAFMKTLQGGCQVPVGCFSHVDSEKITLTGFIASTDGESYLRKQITGTTNEAEYLGQKLATHLLNQGGDQILMNIRTG